MKFLFWCLIGLIGIVALGLSAMFSRRKAPRREFREYLAQKRPDIKVTRETGSALFLQSDSGEDLGTLFLRRISLDSPPDKTGRHASFDALIASLSEGSELAHLGPDDRLRIMPRIVSANTLAGMQRQVPEQIPSVSLGVGDLSVVLVLDSKNSVAYVECPCFPSSVSIFLVPSAGDPLFRKPIVVTAQGFSAAPS